MYKWVSVKKGRCAVTKRASRPALPTYIESGARPRPPANRLRAGAVSGYRVGVRGFSDADGKRKEQRK